MRPRSQAQKGRKKMATSTIKKETTPKETQKVSDMNIWQKLFCVRDEFAQEEVKKSGKNIQLSSMFYELADIVPVARTTFKKYRLIPLDTFVEGKARMTITDVDFPEKSLVFELDVQTYEGNKAVTPPQAYGAVVTYYRRYLYMVALDIVEADYLENGIDPQSVSDKPAVPDTKPVTIKAEPKTPVPTEKPLTDGDGQASELQIKQLKEVLKKLIETDATQEETVAQIAVSTQGFTVISKKDCENLIVKANEMLEKGDK
jgi:hypothetical protein